MVEDSFFMYQHNGVYMVGGDKFQKNHFKIINAKDNSVFLDMEILSGTIMLNGKQISMNELINKLK